MVAEAQPRIKQSSSHENKGAWLQLAAVICGPMFCGGAAAGLKAEQPRALVGIGTLMHACISCDQSGAVKQEHVVLLVPCTLRLVVT
jgi:hypothetical protein